MELESDFVRARVGQAVEDSGGLQVQGAGLVGPTLAQQDVKLRYRGSILGPFWQTLTTAVMIGGMGLIYAELFHTELYDYLPMLTVGLIFWMFIAGMITEGCGTFVGVQGVIQQVRLPFSLHAYRLVYRNLLLLAHNFVIVPIVLLMFPHPISWFRLIELVPGLILILITGLWVSVLLGMISARFRDVPPIVASIVQVVFFMTPVMWPLGALGPERAPRYGLINRDERQPPLGFTLPPIARPRRVSPPGTTTEPPVSSPTSG